MQNHWISHFKFFCKLVNANSKCITLGDALIKERKKDEGEDEGLLHVEVPKREMRVPHPSRLQ